MSLEVNIRNALTRIATEFKGVHNKIGNLSALTTTEKTNLVAALNELKGLIGASGDGLTMLDVENRVQQLIGSAPAALDTLVELAQALGNDANFASTMNSALGFRLRFDAAQTLTAGQKTQGLNNLGAAPADHNHDSRYFTKAEVGDVTANLVTHFEAGLV